MQTFNIYLTIKLTQSLQKIRFALFVPQILTATFKEFKYDITIFKFIFLIHGNIIKMFAKFKFVKRK